MSSRMEKYHKETTGTRSSRNRDLYSNIYTDTQYSNIEGIAQINKDNEIDIAKVRELINGSDNYQNDRKYRREKQPTVESKEVVPTKRFPELEEKNYDIRDVLKEAKEGKEQKENAMLQTEYNILKNIDLQKELKKRKQPEKDLKDMIDSITNTSMLNKLSEDELAQSLFSDLKDDDTQVGQLKSVTTKAKKIDSTNYDRSFFTSSLKLNKSDFVDGEEVKKTSAFSVIIIIILIIVILGCAGIMFMKFIK